MQVEYTPTPKQRMFHASDADEVLYGGAAGGGKSRAIVMDAFARCLRHPGTHAYVFRRTYPELEDTVIREARMCLPKSLAAYNVARHDMRLRNGSEIHFRHCNNEADMNDYAGAEIHWLYVDELTSFTEGIYEFLKTRLRARAELGIVPVVRCASNPGNIGHAWVKKRFVDAGAPLEPVAHEVRSRTLGQKRVFTTQYIPSLATENPHISPEYIFELERKPEALRRALLLGSWDAFEGQVFSEWVDDPKHYGDGLHTHVIRPFAIPDSWPRYMSFDHGYARPFSCGWWAVSPEGVAYRYREWYGCGARANEGVRLSPEQIAAGILEREREEVERGIYVRRVADPAIFDQSRGESVARQMEPSGSRGGVYFEPGEHNRLAGKMQLHERLRFGEDGRPRLYVFSNCRDFIRTVPSLCYDQVRAEDVDTAGEDHIYDETRYFLMECPLAGAMLPGRSKEAERYDPFRNYLRR